MFRTKLIFAKHIMYACMITTPYPFGDRLAEQLHPVGHVLFIVGTELQRRPISHDDLEGVRTFCAV